MAEALRWYLALAVVGGGGLLPAMLLFGGLRSGGLLYARPLALLLVAYVAWTASALGLAPYGTPLVLAALASLWVWSAALGWRRPALLRALWARRAQLLAGEALLLALFALLVLVRAQAPAAQHTEKPMDLALLNAVHGATRLPPPDPWFAGHAVSYYHLGHTMVDVTARLAAVEVGVAFTLGVASAGALAGAAAFALGGDLLALAWPRGSLPGNTPWLAGGVAVISLLVLSTAAGAVALLAANGLGGTRVWGGLGIEGVPGAVGATRGVPDEFWWWWRATRVLPETITEFPAFSLVLGDLHAHLLALPLGVLALALVLPAFAGETALSPRGWLARPGALLLAGLLYAGLVMTNSWDVVLYGLVWAAAATAAFAGSGWPPAGAALGAARYLAAPAAVALVAASPFLAGLHSAFRGVALVTDGGSDPLRLLLVWLPPLLPLAAAVLVLRPGASRAAALRGVALAGMLPLGWALLALASGEGDALAQRGSGWLTLLGLVLAAGTAGATAAAAYRAGERGRAAWLGLAALTAAVVLATELLYIEDAFGSRMNTVFKFWFGAWLLVAVAGGAALAEAAGSLRRRRRTAGADAWPGPGLATRALLGVCAVLYVASLLHAPAAALSRAREGQSPGLDALAYLDATGPGETAALRWVSANLDPERHTLLEAVGPSYGEGNLLSAASGVPTLLGWPGHQLQWRGDGETIAARNEAVARIYAQGASEAGGALAREHGVTHVYLGAEERRQFGPDVARRFAGWPTRFEAAGVRIVEVPR